MSLDPIFPGHEDLYEPSKIYLFGKPFKGLRYVREDLAASEFNSQPDGQRLDMPPPDLEETLLRDRYGPESSPTGVKDGAGTNPPFNPPRQATLRNQPQLARIYSFSHGGNYHKLPCPLIYMVWGPGHSPDDEQQSKESGLPSFETQNTGLEGKGWRFGSDIKVWKMDKNDRSMVIDLEIGDLEDILLEPVFSETDGDFADAPESRMRAASRMRMNSRMRAASRMRMTSRMRMAGPHQD